MNDIALKFEYRHEDESYRTQRIFGRTGGRSGFIRSRYGIAVIVISAALIGTLLTGALRLMMALVIFCILVVLLRRRWAYSVMYADQDSPIYGHKLCTLSGSGIGVESEALKTWLAWKAVRDVEETPKHILFFYDQIRSLAIPKAGFQTPGEQQQFMAFVAQHVPPANIRMVEKRPQLPIASSGGVVAWVWLLLVMGIMMYGVNLANPVYTIPQVTFTVSDSKVFNNTIVLLGNATNTGRDTWQVSMLEVQFFDKKGAFIDQCQTYSAGLMLKAGASERFKIACGVPQPGNPNQIGVIMPDTIKRFDHAEVKAQSGYSSNLLPIFR